MSLYDGKVFHVCGCFYLHAEEGGAVDIPTGRERWNTMIWGVSGCFFGMRKYGEGISSMRTHRFMYVFAISTLLR